MSESEFEKKYVIDVYNVIAKHFDNTRYKPWKSISNFLSSMNSGAIVADIGCGNGRNMVIRNDCTFYGCDISIELVKICQKKDLNVIEGSCLNIPFDSNKFDYTICIAVMGHLSTIERRIKCLDELIRITKPNGLIYIYVWAFEQPSETKKQFINQDSIVTWNANDGNVYDRYYHLFKKDEIEQLLSQFNVIIKERIEEYGNYGYIIEKCI